MSLKDAVIIALIALCAAFFMRAERLVKQHNIARAENQQLRRERDHLIVQYRLTEQAYHALSATELQINQKTKTVIKRIHAAPKGDDAPLAPVLKETLEAIE